MKIQQIIIAGALLVSVNTFAQKDELKALKKYNEALIDNDQDKLNECYEELTELNAWDYEVRVNQILSVLKLTDSRRLISSLSGGQKKLVELGRVLMLEPRCILLDEPFAGVNPVLIDQLSEHIVTLNQEGIAFILIEHHLQALKKLAKRLIVMDRGSILAQGDPQSVLDDPQVQLAYMGGVA